MHIYATAKSDVGRVRERNEDAYLVNESLGLFVVADGMGGHAGGARASRLTVDTLEAFFTARRAVLEAAGNPDEEDPAPPLAQLLTQAVRAACAAVFDAAAADPSLSGMGTTCTLLLLRPGWAYVGHVGDSRCYMQRGTRFLQVTEDHSLVNEQVRAGLLAAEDAAKSRLKNIITRSVGFEREVEVDTFLVPLRGGDQFLLCSDGLSNLVENSELGEAMMAMRGAALLDFLVDVALERGGDDNVTAVCVRVADPPEAELEPGHLPEPGPGASDMQGAGEQPEPWAQATPQLAPAERAADGAGIAAPARPAEPPNAAPDADEATPGETDRTDPVLPPTPSTPGGRPPGPNEDTDPQGRHPRPSSSQTITDPEGTLGADAPTDPGHGGVGRRRPKRR